VAEAVAASADAAGWEGVWPDHVDAVEAFLAVATQWRVVAGLDAAAWVGLDYAGCREGFALAGIEVDPMTWSQIRAIEAGAINALNKSRGVR
jgi:hypothetical protein